MTSHKRTTGPDRLGGAQPPSSGGYGDIDGSAQRVGESDAPEVKQQEPRALQGLSEMNPAAAARPDNRNTRSDEEIEFGRLQPNVGEAERSEAPPIESPDDEVDLDQDRRGERDRLSARRRS